MAASKHTYTCAQCSHASVGLAQTRPNNKLQLHVASAKYGTLRSLAAETPSTHT